MPLMACRARSLSPTDKAAEDGTLRPIGPRLRSTSADPTCRPLPVVVEAFRPRRGVIAIGEPHERQRSLFALSPCGSHPWDPAARAAPRVTAHAAVHAVRAGVGGRARQALSSGGRGPDVPARDVVSPALSGRTDSTGHPPCRHRARVLRGGPGPRRSRAESLLRARTRATRGRTRPPAPGPAPFLSFLALDAVHACALVSRRGQSRWPGFTRSKPC